MELHPPLARSRGRPPPPPPARAHTHTCELCPLHTCPRPLPPHVRAHTHLGARAPQPREHHVSGEGDERIIARCDVGGHNRVDRVSSAWVDCQLEIHQPHLVPMHVWMAPVGQRGQGDGRDVQATHARAASVSGAGWGEGACPAALTGRPGRERAAVPCARAQPRRRRRRRPHAAAAARHCWELGALLPAVEYAWLARQRRQARGAKSIASEACFPGEGAR